MGVNISIYDAVTKKEIPGWDSGRWSGDRDVIHVLMRIPHTNLCDLEQRLRPDDVEQFRAALHAAFDYNTERWNKMCDLLAADPNRGLYFSW